MHLSRRTSWPVDPSPWALQVLRARRSADVLDLTVSDPLAAGVGPPADVLATLAHSRAMSYQPQPLGHPVARRAVADYYAARAVTCSPEQVWIGAGTSELYHQLLVVLCDPGDAIAVPRPGYPLIDFLGRIAGAELVPYDLEYEHGRWRLDFADLSEIAATAPHLRAIVVVAPGNPTGHYLSHDELARLEDLASAHGLALIVDEVFADYPLVSDGSRVEHCIGDRACPTFVLSGLSKVAALPQLKLSWGVACGPVHEALARIEVVADTFLHVSTPVQLALPELLDRTAVIQTAIQRRIRENLACIDAAIRATPIDLLHVEGGWTALLRLPSVADLDDVGWAAYLLEHERVLTHPGYLFDLRAPPRLALSLLVQPDVLQTAISRIVERVCST